MNKVYKFVIGILALTLLLVFGQKRLNASSNGSNDKDIYFYNWGDYVDPEVLKDFEKETGYKVIISTILNFIMKNKDTNSDIIVKPKSPDVVEYSRNYKK